jgi:Ca-activated chloride channel homolog
MAAAVCTGAGRIAGAQGVAMMRGVLLMLMLLVLSPAQAGEFWSRLWRNADQRGEALLKQGDAKNAANEYADPARKAYAKLKAGDYQGAAKDLASLQGSDAAYNRGNALAYSGDLQGALDAYDAALKANPDNQDAKHNRDLVAQQLKQQNAQSQKNGSPKDGQQKSGDQNANGQGSSGQNSSGQNSNGQNSNGQNSDGQNQQGQQGGQAGQDKAGNSGQGKQDNADKEGKSGSAAENDKNIQSNHNDIKQQQSGAGAQPQGQQSPGQQSPAQQAASGAQQKQEAANDAEQARRDAEASLGQAADGAKNTGDKKMGASDGVEPPKTENQLAQEQWLRSIPDDPAGLLRRKFMIEHLIRQQKAQQ